MDINARLNQLCMELGRLDFEIGSREQRRTAIRAELDMLQRIAGEIQRAGVRSAPTPAANGRAVDVPSLDGD